jgi:tape measure domain-containing protein
VSVVANVAINVDTTGALGSIKKLEAAAKGAGADLGNNLKGAAAGATGLGAALQSAIAPLLAITTAAAAVKQSLDTAFARGAAEQRLQNLTSSTGEYKAALAAAASSSEKFGISQTDATKSLADVYGRLKGVGYGLKETTQIYDGFNVIAKQSGMTAEEASGAFFQLSQSLGKGKLNGDEFVTIAERMPGLLDSIAQTTGASRGQLAEMAGQGKITGDVLYQALSRAAGESGGLNDKLTEQQKVFNELTRVSDRLMNTLGKVFAPFVIAGAKLLVEYGKALGDFWDYLGGVVFPKVLKTLQPVIVEIKKLASQVDWKALIGLLQGALIAAVNTFVLALRLVIPTVTEILKRFNAIAASPAFKFISQQVMNLAKLLGISSTAVSDFKTKQDATVQGAADTVNNYSSLPPKIDEAKAAQDRMKESIQASLTGIKEAQLAITTQTQALERGASIASARYATEKAFNDLQGQQLQRSYELATSAEQRQQIAIAIFNQQVAAANIERNQALESINLEQRKLELKLKEAELKTLEIQQAGKLAILEAKSVEEQNKKTQQMNDALRTNQALVSAASDQLGAQQQIAEYQKQAVDAQYEGKILAAQTALEQKLTSDKIGLSQADALRLSNNLAGGVSSSQRLASDTGKISINASSASGNFISLAGSAQQAANSINAAANAQQRLNNLRSFGGGGGGASAAPVKKAATGAYWPGGFQAFAKGGMVTKPTLGLVGEGGQPEYIVPQSKASNFARNVLSGRTGASAINSSSSGSGGGGAAPQVNIQTGPVTQMNGANYVTTQQMSAAVKEGIDQTMRFISRDMNIRRSMGIA